MTAATSTHLLTETLADSADNAGVGYLLLAETLSTPEVFASAEQLFVETLTDYHQNAVVKELLIEVLSLVNEVPLWGGPVRFHEKVALLFGAKQDTVGIPQTLTGTNAIAGLNLSFEDTINTATHEFGEHCLGRSAAISIENIVRTVTFETLFPTVNVSESLTETSLALTDWFKACGAAVSLVGSELQFSNETVDYSRLTVEVQQIPENDPIGQNSYKVIDAIGTVGLDLTAGKLGKFNFTLSGSPELPVYTSRYSTDFGQQKSNVLGPIKQASVLSASIIDLDTGFQNSFCFYKLQTDSLFGFDLTQSQLSDSELFDRVPKPTPLALTVMLSNENSELMVTPEYCLGKRYSMQLRFGLQDFPITLEFTELQMSDYKRITADGIVGLAIGFLNTGFTKLSFTGTV